MVIGTRLTYSEDYKKSNFNVGQYNRIFILKKVKGDVLYVVREGKKTIIPYHKYLMKEVT